MKKLWTGQTLVSATTLCFLLVIFFTMFATPGTLSSQPPASKWPLMDQVAAKVIDKYQKSSCEDLKQNKAAPPSGQEAQMLQKAVGELNKNPEMRTAFLNKVAPPIANKMFECGMIP